MVHNDEDLVKHGKNVPGYLHRGGKSANAQDKTFNFGVIDWSRLESWKSKTKRISKTNNLAKESGSGRLSTSLNNVVPQSNQQALNGCSLNISSRERPLTGVRPRGKSVQFQISETVSGKIYNGLQYSCSVGIPSGSNEKKAKQIITSENGTKKLSEETIDHYDDDDYLCLSGHEKSRDERRLSDCFSEKNFHSLNTSMQALHSFPFHLGTNSDPECPYQIPGAPLRGTSFQENESNLEHLTIKGKRSSLSRRFSFSLEKMTESLGQQLSSTYKYLPALHNSNSMKRNATNIVRSIPMRRLLDTLLKIHRSNRNIICSSIDPSYEKSNTVQALLQVTMKNEIPFFKLVVASSNNILAAAVKKLPSGNDDSSLTYTFYSVQEIKKKRGDWKTQDVVGHMKISSSYHAEFSGLERDLFVVRESVLYGPESDQISMELAAIIVKNTSKENYGGIGSSRSTVVILPGGSHSGQPSPLINRWRSGGACACGGWDIGCELGVLTNQNETIEISSPSTSDRLDLCYQVLALVFY